MFNTVMERIPIPLLNNTQEKELSEKVSNLLDNILTDNIQYYEKEISSFIYNFFSFSEEESSFIEAF